MKRLALVPVIVLAGLSLAGCPDDPHSYKTWTKALGGREHERALIACTKKMREGKDGVTGATKNLFKAQIAAIRAFGKFENEKQKSAEELVKIIEMQPPPHPKTVRDKKQLKATEEKYSFFLATS